MSAIKKLLAVVLAALLSVSAFASGRYSTRNAETDVLSRTGIFQGSMIYLASAASYMPLAGARILSMDAGSEDYVEAGDIIGTYKIEANPADIVRAEKALSQAEADLEYEKARREAEIAEFASLMKAAASADEKRIYELKALRAGLEMENYISSAQDGINSLKANLENTIALSQVQNITAPMTGNIDMTATEGIAIAQGQPTVIMHDSEKVLIKVSDPGGELRYGMEVDLQLSSRTRSTPAKGVVVSCDSVLPAALRSGTAYIAYDAAQKGSAFSGATVTAETARIEGVVTASLQAISYNEGRCRVQILDDDGTVRTRYVKRGLENISDVWIISGVSEGDKLIMK